MSIGRAMRERQAKAGTTGGSDRYHLTMRHHAGFLPHNMTLTLLPAEVRHRYGNIGTGAEYRRHLSSSRGRRAARIPLRLSSLPDTTHDLAHRPITSAGSTPCNRVYVCIVLLVYHQLAGIAKDRLRFFGRRRGHRVRRGSSWAHCGLGNVLQTIAWLARIDWKEARMEIGGERCVEDGSISLGHRRKAQRSRQDF